MELYIVLAIMAFMIVGFVWNKWPFGLTAMTCCVLLALTNVYPIDKAFAGFTNKNVILVAPMFVLSAAFGRTSLLRKIQDKMVVLKGKSGFVLLVALYAVVIALACFLPTTAEMTLMLMFLVSLGNTGDITPSRMTIPILGMLSMWGTKLPIGMGAAAYATYNVYYEGMVTNEGQLLGFLDQFKVAIIPCILVTIYCLFAYKLMPNTSFDETKLKEQKKQEALPKAKENIIYAVFVIVMGSLFFNSALGNMMYIIPAVGILVLTFTKAISVKELVAGLTSDPVWMMVGVLVMADALGSTGAGDLIGQIILKILGGNPSGLFCPVRVRNRDRYHDHLHVQRCHQERSDPHCCKHLHRCRLGPPRCRPDRCHLLQHCNRIPLRLSCLRHRVCIRRLQGFQHPEIHPAFHCYRSGQHRAVR